MNKKVLLVHKTFSPLHVKEIETVNYVKNITNPLFSFSTKLIRKKFFVSKEGKSGEIFSSSTSSTESE